MLRIFVILIFLLSLQLASGQADFNFSKIDKHALKSPRSIETNLSDLVNYLSKSSYNDIEKVRSFYVWLVNNIDYDNAAITPNSKRINHTNQDVLNRKKAVCQGYSNLFKEMCNRSGIPCEVITGYPKTPRNATPDLEKANHTWNAVLLNEQWYLLDITWGASNEKQFVEDYFLAAPENFVIDHLPNDPMWQLLDCPISTHIFMQKHDVILTHIRNENKCFNFRDSINQLMALPTPERKLKRAKNAYKFNPVQENKKYLGSMYIDKINYLSDLSYELEVLDSFEAVMNIQLEIFDLYDKSMECLDLYDHQKENLAYTHFNYAVALSRLLSEESKGTQIIETYKLMLHHFKKGRTILKEVPSNILSENATKQFDDYIEFIQAELKSHQ